MTAKGVVSTWFVESGEQVGPDTLIAEGEEVSQGTPIARVG